MLQIRILVQIYNLMMPNRLAVILLQTVVLSSCSNHVDPSRDIYELMQYQYPKIINISPNGQHALLKTKTKDQFKLYMSELNESKLIPIDSSDFTQLSLTWSPNGKTIVFQEFDPKNLMFDLYKINTNLRERSRLGLPSSVSALPPLKWSANGKLLAYISILPKESRLLVYNSNSKKVMASISGIDEHSDFHWFKDSILVFIRDSRNPILTELNVHSKKRKEHELPLFDAVNKISVKNGNILMTGRTRTEQFFQCYELNTISESVEKKTQSSYNVSSCEYMVNSAGFFYEQNENGIVKLRCSDSLVNNSLIEAGGGEVGMGLLLQKEDTLCVSAIGLSSPRVFKRIFLDTNRGFDTLFCPPYVSKKMKLLPPKFVEITRSDKDIAFPGFFWKSSMEQTKQKAIIFVHGGPYSQLTPEWSELNFILNTYGFNVLGVNYHGSSGYSKDFAETNDIPQQVADIIKAVEFLNESYSINTEDIILMGYSYGGQLILKANNLLNDIGGLVLVSGAVDYSSINSKKSKRTKVLSFYGKYDPLTPYAKSLFSDTNFKESKVFYYREFEKEGHVLHRADSWAEIYTKIIKTFSPVYQ